MRCKKECLKTVIQYTPQKGYIPVMTVLPNVRPVMTVSLVKICVLYGSYGPDGWFGGNSYTGTLRAVRVLVHVLYITVLSIGLWGLSGINCQDCQDQQDCQHSKRTFKSRVCEKCSAVYGLMKQMCKAVCCGL